MSIAAQYSAPVAALSQSVDRSLWTAEQWSKWRAHSLTHALLSVQLPLAGTNRQTESGRPVSATFTPPAPPPTPKPSPIAHPTFTAPLPTPEGQTMYRRRSSALSSGDRGRRGAGRPLPSVASPPLSPFRKPMPPLPSHLRPVHLPRHLIRRVGPTVYSALQSLLAGCKALHTFSPPLSTNERTGAEG